MPILKQLVQDKFQRGNETPLNPANWTFMPAVGDGAGLSVVSDQCAGNMDGGSEGGELYTGVSFPADQYCSVTLGNVNNSISLFIRCASLSAGYVLILSESVSTDNLTVGVLPSPVLGTVSVGLPKPGDVIVFGIQGSSIFVLYNGVQVFSAVDSTYKSGGSTGIDISTANFATDTTIASFAAGTFGLPPFVPGFNCVRRYDMLPPQATVGDLWYVIEINTLYVAVANPNQFFPGLSDPADVTRVWKLGFNVSVTSRSAVPASAPVGSVFLTTDTLEALVGTGAGVLKFRLNVARALGGASQASVVTGLGGVANYFVAVDES